MVLHYRCDRACRHHRPDRAAGGWAGIGPGALSMTPRPATTRVARIFPVASKLYEQSLGANMFMSRHSSNLLQYYR
jgi:hypothetical protein